MFHQSSRLVVFRAESIFLTGSHDVRVCFGAHPLSLIHFSMNPAVTASDGYPDPISTSKIEELAMQLKEQYTIVIVTHNMQQALELGTRTLMMADGRIVLDVSGTDRAGMTVEDLIHRFKAGTGKTLSNDRMLLS